MNNKQAEKISKLISLVLRHKPEVLGLELDEHGWADTHKLLNGLYTHGYELTMDDLEFIVNTDNKQRYSFSDDKKLIRANQGHSIPVDVELEEKIPPNILYHGTGKKYEESIDKHGILKLSRLYVHLSDNKDTAKNVGKRHGVPVIYAIDCKSMVEDGYTFYQSVNGVWLTEYVPFKYLGKIN